MIKKRYNVLLKSPLRYPGGKNFLCRYVEKTFKVNNFTPRIVIEPFAGGASISLHLLGEGLVEKIALYDIDPLVADFWYAVFFDGKWLRKKYQQAKVTLDAWEKLHSLPVNGYKTNAWKCLFLNRTSFSGILTEMAGPLGGKKQSSRFRIDCRFYRRTIENRLKELWSWREKVEDIQVANWEDIVKLYSKNYSSKKKDCFIYLDPPFFNKAERLYNHYFDQQDHERVVRTLAHLKVPWLISYDYCEDAIDLFRKYKLTFRTVPVRYTSSTQKSRIYKKELVASNLILPRGDTP
jgi:DNA adenine methylase